jgi:hypothetical protein
MSKQQLGYAVPESKNYKETTMNKEERRLKTITEKFGGIFNLQVKEMLFPNPITFKSRADALDMLFCLINFDDWGCEVIKPYEALKKFIEEE